MESTPIWILTFNRPAALNRLITELGRQGFRSNVLSNHSLVQYTEEASGYVDSTIHNTLNTDESNAWCGRSWNSMMIKAFMEHTDVLLIQDDTFLHPNFGYWFKHTKAKYDFIWGPAGDQFFYLKLDVLRKTGWFDERYVAGYCGDADFMKRVYHCYDLNKLSIEESHDWGFRHNPSGISQVIITEMSSKHVDRNYENAHWHMERMKTQNINRTLLYSQAYYAQKWGQVLNNNRPLVETNMRQIAEIDWYPWATNKFKITAYDKE